MKKIILVLTVLFSGLNMMHAQNYTIPLWDEGAIPNFKASTGEEVAEVTDIIRISNVQKPQIEVFLPAKPNANGQAVVVCPGGGYHILAYDWEGIDIAKWLNANGIAAIVLKYRLPVSGNSKLPYLSPLLDVQRALRITRYNAVKWNISPFQIGVMGFSAGGHLASTAGTHFDNGNTSAQDPVDRLTCRPDFMVLVYPVISFTADFMHKGSEEALLGKNADENLINNFSNELQVKEKTPPTFLIHAADDNVVPVENSIAFFNALNAKKIPAELHIYPTGGHGFSLAANNPHLHQWTDLCIEWIHSQNKEEKKE